MTRKQYTRQFKLKVVQAVETGELRPAQACREYQLAESVLTRWRHEVRQRGDAAFSAPQASATENYEQQIAELERVCGQLAIAHAARKKHCDVPTLSQARVDDGLAAGVPNFVSTPTVQLARPEPLVGLRAG